MAVDRTFTQWRNNTAQGQHSSAPESSLSNYISNFHDYFSMRIGQNVSIMVIGDYNDGTYENCKVYTYNSDQRSISVSEADTVTCTVYENYYTRGNIEGIPSVPTYTIESHLVNSLILFLGVSIFLVTYLVTHFWKIVRRSSHA